MRRIVGVLLIQWLILTCTGLRAAPLFFVAAEVDQPAPRVQAEVRVTLSFFQGGDVRDVKFIAPPLRLADIEPEDKPSITEVMQDGVRYRRHQQTYRVRPFASGPLELSGLGVAGRRPGAQGREQWLAPVLHLTVRPAPTGTDHWLPARQVSLREIALEQPAPAVGQPWLRTLVIEGDGVEASALPELSMTVDGATVIARPPRTDQRLSGNRRLLVREQTFEIVPQRAGSLRLPPVVVAWWEVTGDVPAVSRLPARDLAVRGPPLLPREPWVWPAWSLWLGAVLGVMFFVYRSRFWWRVQLALFTGRPESMRRALLEWGCARWREDPPLNLLALASRLGKAGAGVRALDGLCYGAGGTLPRLGWRMLWIRRQVA